MSDQSGEFHLALDPRGYQITFELDGSVALSERVVPSAMKTPPAFTRVDSATTPDVTTSSAMLSRW